MADDLEIEVGADVSEFNRKIDGVERKISGMRGFSFSNIQMPDFKEFHEGFRDIKGGPVGAFASFLVQARLLEGSLALLSAGVGIAAGQFGILLSSVTAAAGGLTGYGAVAAPVLIDLIKLNEGLKDGSIKWSELTEKQHDSIHAMREFSDFYKGFADQFEEPVLNAFMSGLKGLEGTLNELKPTIEEVAPVITDLLDSFRENLKADDMQEFFGFLEENAAPVIEDLSKGLGNLLVGILNIAEAFGDKGEAQEMSEGFLELTERFREWTDELENNKQFQKFVDWVKEETPGAVEDIMRIVEALIELGDTYGPIGLDILDFIGNVADWIKKMDQQADDVREATEEMQGYLEDFFEWLGDVDLWEMGEDIAVSLIDGMTGGLASKAGDLYDEARKIAGNIDFIFKHVLQIKSPSRKGRAVGVHYGEGVEWGLHDKIKDVEMSAGDLARAVLSGGIPNNSTPSISSERENISSSEGEKLPPYVILNIEGHEAKGVLQYMTEQQEIERINNGRARGYDL